MTNKQDLENSINSILNSTIETDKVSKIIPKLNDDKPTLYGTDGIEFTGSILFIDLRGSTKLFEKHSDNVIAKMLMSYHVGVTKIAKCYEGKIRSFNGDSVLIFFNGDTKEIVNKAVKCAMQINYYITNILNPKLEAKNYNKLNYGIGIDHGKVLCVKVGIKDEGNRDLIWISDNVNMSAKLSDLGSNPYHIYITKIIYDNLDELNKYSKLNNMWTYSSKIILNKYIDTYYTNYHWSID